MPSFELKSALEFSIPVLADLLTRGFEGYFVPIAISDVALLTMVRRDGVDLSSSRVYTQPLLGSAAHALKRSV